MMDSTCIRGLVRSASRHPRRTVDLGLLASAVTSSAAHTRDGYRAMAQPVKRAATDRRVHCQSKRAAADLARAIRQARRIGVADATTDRRVARGFRRAARHASRALVLTVAPPPSHKKRNAAVAALGVGGVTAGVIAARRSPQTAAEDTPTPDSR